MIVAATKQDSLKADVDTLVKGCGARLGKPTPLAELNDFLAPRVKARVEEKNDKK